LNAVQSIGSSTLNALEVIGGWNAKVGNALKKWGVVSEKAYEYFNPTPNFQNKFFTRLEKAENLVSQLGSISSETLSVKENVKQIFELKDDLRKNLKDEDENKKEQPTIESLREKIKAAKESETSKAPAPLTSFDKSEAD